MSSEKTINKSGEELWDEFKISFGSLLDHMDEGARSLLVKLTLENKKLKKENEELREEAQNLVDETKEGING